MRNERVPSSYLMVFVSKHTKRNMFSESSSHSIVKILSKSKVVVRLIQLGIIQIIKHKLVVVPVYFTLTVNIFANTCKKSVPPKLGSRSKTLWFTFHMCHALADKFYGF